MKEIDITKIREAIHFLRSQGRHEGAACVWDLLDEYVSRRPEPLVFPAGGEDFPKCQNAKYMADPTHACTAPVAGDLITKVNNSYPLCIQHGKEHESPGFMDYVQTYFGEE
jgi:hypothetical protein